MMRFEVSVSDEDRLKFAEFSGDKNPLHIDQEYASKTNFKKCIIHGAFPLDFYQEWLVLFAW